MVFAKRVAKAIEKSVDCTRIGVGVVGRAFDCDNLASFDRTSLRSSLRLSVVLLFMVSAVMESLKTPFFAWIVPFELMLPSASIEATTAFFIPLITNFESSPEFVELLSRGSRSIARS